MKHKLESRLPGYADDTTLMAESEKELKSLLMKVKEQSEKAALKLNILRRFVIVSSKYEILNLKSPEQIFS